MRTIAPGVLTRRRFLKFLAAAGGAACLGAGRGAGAAETPPASKPAFRFAVLADVQYADVESQGHRHYRESLPKLEHAVTELNKLKPDFVVQLGDFIDHGFANFDPVLAAYAKLTVPAYHVLGNHDFAVEAVNRGKVLGKLGLDKLGGGQGYYDFAGAGWRLVVLNGMEGNESVLPRQLKWLKETLAKAAAAGERTIVFCHFPVYPCSGRGSGLNLKNATEVVEILESAKGVVAYIAGHKHVGAYAQNGSTHFLTLKGMVEAVPTAYALIEVFPGCLKVTGFGSEPRATRDEPRATSRKPRIPAADCRFGSFLAPRPPVPLL